MKLKFLLLGIITLLSCASCSLLEPTVEEDEYGNRYTTNICTTYTDGYGSSSKECHDKSKLRKGFEDTINIIRGSGVLNLLVK